MIQFFLCHDEMFCQLFFSLKLIHFDLIGNPHCPVNSFEKYIAKLNPDCHFLWQRPKNFTEEDYDPPIW